MSIVSNILKEKGNTVWSISPEATAFEALQVLADKDIGAIVVTSNDSVVGIFSERDYARKIALQGKTSKDTPVSELMSKDVFAVSPEENIENCMEIMTEKRIRHLPVIENGKLSGIITIGDVVKEIISEHKSKIDNLEKYIYSG